MSNFKFDKHYLLLVMYTFYVDGNGWMSVACAVVHCGVLSETHHDHGPQWMKMVVLPY